MIDLLKIARTEAAGGDLLTELGNLYEPADIQPSGFDDAIVWKGGNHNGNVNPVAHALTDAYALLGTVAAIDVLGLPHYSVPMWAQIRHDKKLAPLGWFGNMPCTSINRCVLQRSTLWLHHCCALHALLTLLTRSCKIQRRP